MLYGYHICAVCMSHLHEDVLREFLAAFSDAAAPLGWRVLVFATGSDLYWKTQQDAGQATIFELIDMESIDALCYFEDKLLDPAVKDRLTERCQENAVPVFTLNGEREGTCSITFDYERGFAGVVHHLIEHHGITDFHYISGMKDNDFAKSREDVMRRALAEHGIPFTDENISYGDFWAVPARAAVKKLVKEHRVPKAIVCANDSMAIAASVELMVNGYRVPQDVIVTGFDGIAAINFSIPKITSAKCDFTGLGQKVAALLGELTEGKPLPERVVLVPALIQSESCGCVPRTEMNMVDYINEINDNFNRFRNEDERLYALASDIQACNEPAEVSEVLHHHLFYCMSLVLKQEVLNTAVDPGEIQSGSAFGEKLYILCDSDWWENEGKELPVRELAPRMEELLCSGKPVVFMALHHLEVPLGYLCFHYQDTAAPNYLKIYQTAMSLSSALSGFRNKRYREHLQSVVEEMYKYDALTGLFNRSAFLKDYNRLAADQPDAMRTLVLCDLDGLKYINDHFSHTEGDNAIAVAANALHTVCRMGLCCRYGGDEMIAVLMEDADPAAIRRQILEQLAAYNSISGKPYEVSASIGVYAAKGMDFETMFSYADQLMYADKQGKKHRRD